MYQLLVKLIVMAALAQFFDFENCYTRKCFSMFEKSARDVLKIEWKPISVFSEEAKRFCQL